MYKLNKYNFLEKFKEKHGNKYNYDSVVYKNNSTKVKIECIVHGIFEQAPKDHFKGQTCAKCYHDSMKLTKDKFIEKAIKIHVDKYIYDDINVSCYASPSNPQVGSRMNWYARVDGGDGDYDYDWSGNDGLNSSSRSPYMTYDFPGSKRATVTVTDGSGNEDTATCYANVNSVLAFSQINQQPLVDAVYLNQMPYTGVADNMKLYLFIGMLALFSAYIAYVAVSRNPNPYK